MTTAWDVAVDRRLEGLVRVVGRVRLCWAEKGLAAGAGACSGL